MLQFLGCIWQSVPSMEMKIIQHLVKSSHTSLVVSGLHSCIWCTCSLSTRAFHVACYFFFIVHSPGGRQHQPGIPNIVWLCRCTTMHPCWLNMHILTKAEIFNIHLVYMHIPPCMLYICSCLLLLKVTHHEYIHATCKYLNLLQWHR